ncbi:hypothetical protein BS78_08G072700 [Paspalum vaginatum]|nr:hypothetical protein BS78_08G072700 [Paspalum vaginatum]
MEASPRSSLLLGLGPGFIPHAMLLLVWGRMERSTTIRHTHFQFRFDATSICTYGGYDYGEEHIGIFSSQENVYFISIYYGGSDHESYGYTHLNKEEENKTN